MEIDMIKKPTLLEISLLAATIIVFLITVVALFG
jgi:hypothetical protein